MFYSIKKHNISLATNEKLHVFSEHQIGHPTCKGRIIFCPYRAHFLTSSLNPWLRFACHWAKFFCPFRAQEALLQLIFKELSDTSKHMVTRISTVQGMFLIWVNLHIELLIS